LIIGGIVIFKAFFSISDRDYAIFGGRPNESTNTKSHVKSKSNLSDVSMEIKVDISSPKVDSNSTTSPKKKKKRKKNNSHVEILPLNIG